MVQIFETGAGRNNKRMKKRRGEGEEDPGRYSAVINKQQHMHKFWCWVHPYWGVKQIMFVMFDFAND